MRRVFTFSSLFALVCLSLLAVTEADAQRYSGRATAIETTVGVPGVNPLTTAVNDTGELPSSGGNINLTSASTSIAGAALTAGATSSSTTGGTPGGTSHSETSVANLNFSVLGNIISATAVSTETDCSCPSETCTGSTTITGLTLNGGAVTVTGSANQTIILTGPLGGIVGTLVINEQIIGVGSITVNGLHVNVTDSITGILADIVVASSHSDIICVPLASDNYYSGRAYGIGSTVTTEDILLGTSSVATRVADTGPLPGSGGAIGPVTVAGAALPGLVATGTLSSSTSGGNSGGIRVSDSSASVETLNATVAGFTITATVLTSETHCECAPVGTDSICTGGSVVADLSITVPIGGTINGTVTGAPNETVTLSVFGVVVATLIFNEQVPVSPTDSGSITVNALHIITSTSIPGVSTSTTDTIIASSHSDIVCGIGPSSAAVSLSGVVLNEWDQGISQVRIQVTDASGNTQSTLTNQFGFFAVNGLRAGEVYIVEASSKRYVFDPIVLSLDDEIGNFEIRPSGSGTRKK